MKINILLNQNPAAGPKGKLADAEILFDDGLLKGLKLVGFAVWKSKETPNALNVTFPSRPYTQAGTGQKRSYTLLRSQGAHDSETTAEVAGVALRDAVLVAYTQVVLQVQQAHSPVSGDFGHSTLQTQAEAAAKALEQKLVDSL